MAKDKKFDDIFDDTTKKAPATKTARKTAEKTPPAQAAKAAVGGVEVDGFAALNTALAAHHEETLARKAREDRYFVWSSALIAAILLGGVVTFYGQTGVGWFFRILTKLLLSGAAVAVAFYAASLIDDNRKKIRDLMSVVVKINERLGFFDAGRYDDTDEPFFPNAYKFAGSDVEDESSTKALFVRAAAIVTSFVILFVV